MRRMAETLRHPQAIRTSNSGPFGDNLAVPLRCGLDGIAAERLGGFEVGPRPNWYALAYTNLPLPYSRSNARCG